MNRLSLIRWPGSGTGASGSTTAADGLSVNSGVIVLGQLVGQVGNPASLIENREIPFAGKSILFSGIGSVAGSHLIFKYAAAAPANNEPFVEVQSSDGTTLGEIRFGNSILDGDGIAIGKNNGVAGNRGIYMIGDNILGNPGTLRDSIFIGANILEVAPATTQEKMIIIGHDSLDFLGNAGSYIIAIGHDVCDALDTDNIASSQIFIGNFINNASYPGGGVGTGNIAIGQSIGIGGGATNTTLLGNNIVTTLSNVAFLSVSTQSAIIGAAVSAQTSNGATLQIVGNFTTADPGSGVGKWMVGQHHLATVSFNTTGYLEVNVDGVVYKVALTN
jgi:hypothetical protein